MITWKITELGKHLRAEAFDRGVCYEIVKHNYPALIKALKKAHPNSQVVFYAEVK